MKKFILVFVGIVGCGKCPCPPTPVPPPAPVVPITFTLEGKAASMEVKMMGGTKLTPEDVKRQLGLALSMIE